MNTTITNEEPGTEQCIRDMEEADVHYKTTNETLAAIVAGLAPKEGDRILAICGSGDQALALLEYASAVTAIDQRTSQIQIALRKKELLRRGAVKLLRDFYTRLDAPRASDGNILYLSEERLSNIARKIDALKLEVAPLQRFSRSAPEFNKAYLSNAVRWYCDNGPMSDVNMIENVLASLETGGLLYFANGEKISEFLFSYPDLSQRLASVGSLTLEAELAETDERWAPKVYRKVA